MELIKRINENKILTDEIKKMSNSSYLNLIHPEWLTHLKNNALYQKYLNNQIDYLPPKNYTYIKSQRVKKFDDFFKVIVVGRFIYNSREKSSTFTAVNCEPLEELVKVFTDGDSNRAINYRANFFVESCGGIYACAFCQSCKEKYKLNYNDDKEWWCIDKTKIFNGMKVVLSSKCHVESAFGKNPFLAIFQLVISARQLYDVDNRPNIKLSGTVKNMILFKESALESYQPSNLNFITDTCSTNTTLHEQELDRTENVNKTVNDSTQSILAEVESGNFQFTQNFEKTIQTNENVCLPNSVIQSHENNESIKRELEEDNDEYDVVHEKKLKLSK